MSLENELAELICSPIPLLEEIILNPHSSKEELYSIIPVLEDIINNSNSLLYIIKKRIEDDTLDYIRQPVFYKDKLPSTCPNKYMVEKIWGLPFMRQREPWPKDADGNFLLFLCQIFDAENPNILYRIFLEKCDEPLGNYIEIASNGAFAFLPQIKHKYIIMPIELDKSKWLKSTAMVFKHMPHLIGEHFIKDWELCSPTESKKYALSIKERLEDIFL
jgi:hypothetical protein